MIQEKKIKTFLRILIYKPQGLVLKLYKKKPAYSGLFFMAFLKM
jgi:hypothetical protein